jgi:hypothetical protein
MTKARPVDRPAGGKEAYEPGILVTFRINTNSYLVTE